MIGPNGVGKSTTLKVICGLVLPHFGEILFQGKKINGSQPYQLVRKGLSLVSEGRKVFTSMTVMKNLEMGGYILKKNIANSVNGKNKLKNSIKNIFEIFPVLKERRKQKAGALSSGEQQLLAIARALILNPKLFLLDEPSLSLSPNNVKIVFEKIREINKKGTTILVVEQNARMALEYADRGYIFEVGGIIMNDTAKNLLNNEKVKKSFLGEINYFG